jgi:hypothetical protein
MEEGEAKRITKITQGVVHGVSSSGGFWSWSLDRLLAAADSQRIQQTTLKRPHRPPAPARHRLYRSEAARKRLAEIRSHPLIQSSGDDLPHLVTRTVQALRRDKPAEPPALLTLLLIAEAGAEAENLGQLVAFPKRKGGGRSRNADVAREAQLLLERFKSWVEGGATSSLLISNMWSSSSWSASRQSGFRI